MKGCMTAAEISKYLTLSSIKDHPWHIQSCCALTGEGWVLPSMKGLWYLSNVFFYCCSITTICIFSPPLHSTPAKPTSLPASTPPPWFCPCVLYSSSWKPLSPLAPPPSPLAIVRLLLTSMSLVIFCLLFSFVDYVPVKGEIIRYLSLPVWLIFSIS